jgi:hypothetical protein
MMGFKAILVPILLRILIITEMISFAQLCYDLQWLVNNSVFQGFMMQCSAILIDVNLDSNSENNWAE